VGIENIGVQIENPVRVLPMHRICVGVKTAALSMATSGAAVAARLDQALAAAAVGKGAAGAGAEWRAGWSTGADGGGKPRGGDGGGGGGGGGGGRAAMVAAAVAPAMQRR
jgi:hypothetical protein